MVPYKYVTDCFWIFSSGAAAYHCTKFFTLCEFEWCLWAAAHPCVTASQFHVRLIHTPLWPGFKASVLEQLMLRGPYFARSTLDFVGGGLWQAVFACAWHMHCSVLLCMEGQNPTPVQHQCCKKMLDLAVRNNVTRTLTCELFRY